MSQKIKVEFVCDRCDYTEEEEGVSVQDAIESLECRGWEVVDEEHFCGECISSADRIRDWKEKKR